MTKNKGSRIIGRDEDNLLVVASNDSQPTIDEIVGSRDKSSLLDEILKEYLNSLS